MSAIPIDTLQLAERLKEAGFTEQQAEVLTAVEAGLIESNIANKRDLKELETVLTWGVKELETALRRDMKEMEAALRRDVKEMEAALRRDMKEMELRLEVKVADAKADLIRWVVSAGILQTAIIAALLVNLVKS